jgi:alpha-tubulin suppressor-like RCC1 family protein
VQGLSAGVTAIACGGYHSCAIVNSAVKCWGENTDGEVGDNSAGTDRTIPVQVSGLITGASAVSASFYSSCAVVSGSVKCWGGNSNGELGDNSTSTNSLVPVQVYGLTSGGLTLLAKRYHNCAVVSNSAKCWGQGSNGKLGNSDNVSSNVPVQVQGLTTGVTAIAGGGEHSCAVVSGSAKCWGYNTNGQLGDGSNSNSTIPVQVSILTSGVTAIATADHSCAIANGIAYCWGDNTSGQLGEGSLSSSALPVKVKLP